MKKIDVRLRGCSVTLNNPFPEAGPKCPAYVRIEQYLMKNGWEQTNYSAISNDKEHFCNMEYEKDGTEGVVHELEIMIHGITGPCEVRATLGTYEKDNRIALIEGLKSEQEIAEHFEALLKEMRIKI